ncbi:MAG: Smr/MutS family protein [Thermodesulfobacteriota bacterium]
MESTGIDSEDVVELAVDGVLDLHTFQPSEIKRLIPEYIRLCQDKKIYALRIIHGKGKGVLRRLVHGILDKEPAVRSYRLAGEDGGSWGATLVDLKPLETHPGA